MIRATLRSGTLACALALGFRPASAQFRLPRDLDAQITRAMRTFQVPGLAIAVVKDGQVVLAKGYGVRRLGDSARVDAHTLFQIASNTKAFTTASLAMLAEDGKLSWDDPVTRWLPWFALSDPWVTREFTIRDLLTHRSGLGLGAGDLVWWHSNYSREDVVRHLRAAKPVTSFRSGYAYDNVLYIAAGLVIEAASGKKWEDFVRDRIFVPLGMTEANTSVTLFKPGDDVAFAHEVHGGKLQVVDRDTVDNTAPAGGINANVTDLAKWMIAQLDSGRVGTTRLWSPGRTREMWSPQTILPIGDPAPELLALRPNFSAYGLGWFLSDYRGHKIVWHTGGLTGMTSRTTLVPDQRLGVVILTNGESPLFHAITYHILDDVFGAPATDWVGAFDAVTRREEARGDSIVRAASAGRDSLSQPSLPLASYTGIYHDALYGDAALALEGDHLVLRFSRSPAFTGDLSHWQYNTFKAHWRSPNLEDAFVTFSLEPDGSIEHFEMAAVSPLADFSFDYQDLLFVPIPEPPSTDVWLAPLTRTGGKLAVGAPANVTHRPGYDNQPAFTPDGKSVLYTVRGPDGQADTWRYDIAARASAQVTHTPESEYSPRPIPSGSGFSVVRVEADSAQRLWRFAMDGTAPQVIAPDLRAVAYYAWGDSVTLVADLIASPDVLEVVDARTGKAAAVAQNVGRAVQPVPGRRAVSFTAQTGAGEWWLEEVNLDTRAVTKLARLPGHADYAWTPDGTVLRTDGARLLAWTAPDTAWRPVAEFTDPGLRKLSRIAVSPAGDWVALVSEEAGRR